MKVVLSLLAILAFTDATYNYGGGYRGYGGYGGYRGYYGYRPAYGPFAWHRPGWGMGGIDSINCMATTIESSMATTTTTDMDPMEYRVKLWPNGRVPYVISEEFDSSAREKINEAMEEFNQKTCVNFEPRLKSDQDYVHFVPHQKICVTRVGNNGLDSPIYMPAVPMAAAPVATAPVATAPVATAPMPAAPMPAQAQPETDVTQMVKRDAEALPTFEITKSFSLGFGGHRG